MTLKLPTASQVQGCTIYQLLGGGGSSFCSGVRRKVSGLSPCCWRKSEKWAVGKRGVGTFCAVEIPLSEVLTPPIAQSASRGITYSIWCVCLLYICVKPAFIFYFYFFYFRLNKISCKQDCSPVWHCPSWWVSVVCGWWLWPWSWWSPLLWWTCQPEGW